MDEKPEIVYVVDDDKTSRALVSRLVNDHGLACEAFTDAGEFLERHGPDLTSCLVLDVLLPGMTGLELQGELNRRGAIIPIIFITGSTEVSDAVAAMRQGAFAYFPKPFDKVALIDAIRGALVQSRHKREALLRLVDIRERILGLSPQERNVLDLLALGDSNKTMAEKMHLSQRTIETHRANMLEKMGTQSTANVIRLLLDFQR